MKKLFIVALAAMSMVACMNEEITELPNGGEITFDNAFIDNATRAELTAENMDEFKVWGYIADEEAGATSQTVTLFEGDKVSNETGAWQYTGGARYWAPGWMHYFEAVAPLTDAVVVNAAEGNLGKIATIDYTVDGESDLIYAAYSKEGNTDGSDNGAVAFGFDHLLSRIMFTFNNGFAEADGITLTVKDVKMTVPAEGQYNVEEGEWTVDTKSTTTLTNIEGAKFVLPYGDSYAYNIEFKVDVTYKDVVINKDVQKKSTVMVALEKGNSYNFTATIDAESLNMESIEFIVGKVEGWTSTDTEMGVAYVSTVNALQAALNNPEVVKVVATNSLTIAEGENVTLNLNGKTVENPNGYIIENMGNLTINGEGNFQGLGGIRSQGGKITYNGGVFTASSNWSTGTYQHVLKAVNTEVVINDATFDATIGGGNNAMINVSEGATVTINGGKFKNAEGTIPEYPNYIFTYEKDGKLIINDGEFYGGWRFNGETATTDIYGGDFTVGYDGQSFQVGNTHKLTVYGGTFTEIPTTRPSSLTSKLNDVVAEGYSVVELNGKYEVVKGAVVVAKNTAELQAALDAATTDTTIRLAANTNYDVVYMGRPTKNNATTMYCESDDFTTTDAAEFAEHLGDGKWHSTPRYTTTLKNLTIIGAEGAKVAGLVATSGHCYGDVYDYVLDKDYEVGSAYYSTLFLENVKFLNVDFTGKIDINTSDAASIFDGVTFEGCTFTTGGIASANGCAVRYYNEANNGNVKNIVVKDCNFNNAYQGIYVHHVNGITVADSNFEKTGHNAIAIQGHDGAVNLKNVVITNNTFNNIHDRVIRFNNIGADSNITIQGNTATNSGDDEGEVIKANSIEAGVTTSISGNNWNGGTVVNPELQ